MNNKTKGSVFPFLAGENRAFYIALVLILL